MPRNRKRTEIARLRSIARKESKALTLMLEKGLILQAEEYFYSLPVNIYDNIGMRIGEKIQSTIDNHKLKKYQEFAISKNWTFKFNGITERFTPKII